MENGDRGKGVTAAGGSFLKVTGRGFVKVVQSEMRPLKTENVKPDSQKTLKTVSD